MVLSWTWDCFSPATLFASSRIKSMNASAASEPVRQKFPPPPTGASRWNGRASPAEPVAAISSLRDYWPLVVAVTLRWRWLAAAGAARLVLRALGGPLLWSTGHAAVAPILRYENPDPPP